MGYRTSARTAGRGPAVFFYRAGPARRWLVALAGLAGVAVCLAEAGGEARDTWLRCERTGTAPPECALEQRSVFGVVGREPVPQLSSARADQIARGGFAIVLSSGFDTEQSFLEATRARPDGRDVAVQIEAYLGGAQPRGAWLLREGNPPIGVLFACVALGSAAIFASAFRATRVSFDPSERRVDVRLRRWPERAQTISVPIDAIERAEAVGPSPGYGRTVRLRGARDVDLRLAYRSEGAAERAARDVDEALARWRSA